MPSLLAPGNRERPIKKIAHVSEDLRGGAGLIADMETQEVIRSATQGFPAAVGHGGDGVAEKLACRTQYCGHAAIPLSDRTGEEECKRRDAESAEKKKRGTGCSLPRHCRGR